MKTRNSHGLLQLHVGREALAYCQCLYRENKALFASVDLIREKNQVMLEYAVMAFLLSICDVIFTELDSFDRGGVDVNTFSFSKFHTVFTE